MDRLNLMSGLALAFGLLIASNAAADVPLPLDLRKVDPQIVFEGVDKHGDYIFFLRCLTYRGNPTGRRPNVVVEVKNANSFRLDIGDSHVTDFTLLAMKRDAFQKLPEGLPGPLSWTGQTAGVLLVPVDEPIMVVPARAKEVPLSKYRVRIEDGKLTVNRIIATTKSLLDAEPAPLRHAAIGVCLSTAVVLFGVRCARRRTA